jgi:hypothetical protein
MPVSKCINCHCHTFSWIWEEAFDKFGFSDGDGQNETGQVEGVLADAGYAVKMDAWGLHNEVIVSIKKDGQELIPFDDPEIAFGYTDARDYLPAEIIALLDEKFPEDE